MAADEQSLYELANYGFAVPGMTFWGDSPFLYAVTTVKTQDGKSNIRATVLRLQLGKAAIRQTTLRTQTGISRVTKVVPRTQTGIARIGKTVLQTQTGKANLVRPKFHTLTDNFDDNSLDPTKWVQGFAVPAVEQNNRIEMPLPASFTTSGLETVYTYDIISSYVLLEMYNFGEYFDIILFTSSSSAGAEFQISSGVMYFYLYNNAGTNIYFSSLAYNATTHRWLRIREAAGIVYYETSPDSVTWTTRGQFTYTFTVTDFKAQILAANPSGVAHTTYLDNFNVNFTTTPQTQTGKARVTATTTKTQTGVSRVTATTTRTQTGKARITTTVTKTQTGVARIIKTVARTQTGIARITATTTRTQTGVSNIESPIKTRTQTGVARITVTATRTQTGQSRITQVVLKTQTGIARITATTPRTQTGKASIASTAIKTQTGTSNIQILSVQQITGKSLIAQLVVRTQTGTARIVASIDVRTKGEGDIQFVSPEVIIFEDRPSMAGQPEEKPRMAQPDSPLL